MHCCRIIVLFIATIFFVPVSTHAENRLVVHKDQLKPAIVKARYSLKFNGVNVGRLKLKSNTSETAYSIAGSAKVSVLFGALKFSGASSVIGTFEQGGPNPGVFKFNWRRNKKLKTSVQMAFEHSTATQIDIKPQPRVKPDTVPLKTTHLIDTIDPMSAVLMLTREDGTPPCKRRFEIFDGKHRYDLVLTPKRRVRLRSLSQRKKWEAGYVCRITYEPIAGHRNNKENKQYRSNQNAEIILRRVHGSGMLIPHAVNIPTKWGTGSMVADRIDISTNAGKITLAN